MLWAISIRIRPSGSGKASRLLFPTRPFLPSGKGALLRPEARRERLLVEEVGDDLVIYDLQSHRAHRLNRAAALVWRSCDGRKTIAALNRVLERELNSAIDEAIVWKALCRLGKARLLREPVRQAAAAPGMTRRQVLATLGRNAGLALLLPFVTSITVPASLVNGHRPAQKRDRCEEAPCKDACRDLCKSDADCLSSNPLCRIFSCSNPSCGRCLQRRCTKRQTPFQIKPIED